MNKLPVCFSMVLLTVNTVVAQSAPPPSPPIGPPTFRSNSQQIGVGIISNNVKKKVEEIVKATNDSLKAQGKDAAVELMSIEVSKPYRAATEYTNRPNQWFVKIPMSIGLEATARLPIPVSRKIYIPLDVNISCENWQTNSGTIQIVGRPGPVSVEGGNILEEVVGIKNLIDGRVKRSLSNLGSINVDSSNPIPCGTIGVSPGELPDYRFGFIAYNKPVRIPPFDGARAVPSVEVTFLKLKRLNARGLYKPVEEIRLEAYANHIMQQSPLLNLREGQESTLNFPPFSLKSDAIELLVVIANINQQPNSEPQDSAFDAWRKSMNFSPGLHTLQISKVEKQLPGPGRPKPTFTRVPAYELTYKVTNTNPGLIR